MKVTIAGAGYVGLGNASLFSNNRITIYDIDKKRVDSFNEGHLHIDEPELYDAVIGKNNITATHDKHTAYNNADFVIVATSTDLDDKEKRIKAESVEEVIKDASYYAPKASIIIRSTVPVGFTEKMHRKYGASLLFCPEFLREGFVYRDTFMPDRIIIGLPDRDEKIQKKAEEFANLMTSQLANRDVPILLVNSSEAEAIKLFSNAYLALRVCFFNELDAFAEIKSLDAENIINGVCLDRRIGHYYNNPSFGYGGYCLPKDSKHLLYEFDGMPSDLIRAIVHSNIARKQYISSQIIAQRPETVGVYRLTMKSDSDNFRESCVHTIIDNMHKNSIRVLVFEPLMEAGVYDKFEVIGDIDRFAKTSDIIIANRYSNELDPFKYKVYSRDVFSIS